jgi:DHA2 family multidrug resistance protein
VRCRVSSQADVSDHAGLLISIYPRHKRGQAIALLAMVTVVAPIAGPILGGWITDNYSWEWIFFINVPIGLFASAVVGSQLRGRPERLEKPKWTTSA